MAHADYSVDTPSLVGVLHVLEVKGLEAYSFESAPE
jgi:hypothetical protein